MNGIKILLLLALTTTVNNSFGQKDIDALLLRLNDILANENIPGAMISIVNSDSIIFAGGIGYADIKKQEQVTGDHLFRLGSISKSFTALGIVKLATENKVKLSTTIDEIDHTLGIKNSWKKEAPISIEQILEHTAGFDDVHNHARYPSEDIGTLTCSAMVKAHRKSLYARWKPGVRKAYSNPGYVLAGYLMEVISKRPYDQYLKDEILSPLGMKDSGFYFKSQPEMLMTQGYKREGGKISPIEFKSVQGGPASDFCSNAKEMSLFLRYMMSGKIPETADALSPIWLNRIENPATTLAAKNGCIGGYGLGSASIWTNNHLFHGHDGGIDGFSSMYLYSREADFGLAISINTQGRIWNLIDEILNFYLGVNTYHNIETKPISNETKSKFEGFYNFKSPRNQTMHFVQKMMTGHTITFEGNLLMVKDFGGVIRDTLYHKGNNEFYRKSEGVPFVMLLENENKQPVLWLGNEYAEKGNRSLRVIKNYLLFACIIMSIQYFFVGFFWWLLQFFKKLKKSKTSRLILWISSACLMLTIIGFLLTTELYERPETINLGSITVFLGSIAFFVSSILSVVKSFKLPEKGRIFKWYYRWTAFSLFVLALWLLSNHFIGFRLWAY